MSSLAQSDSGWRRPPDSPEMAGDVQTEDASSDAACTYLEYAAGVTSAARALVYTLQEPRSTAAAALLLRLSFSFAVAVHESFVGSLRRLDESASSSFSRLMGVRALQHLLCPFRILFCARKLRLRQPPTHTRRLSLDALALVDANSRLAFHRRLRRRSSSLPFNAAPVHAVRSARSAAAMAPAPPVHAALRLYGMRLVPIALDFLHAPHPSHPGAVPGSPPPSSPPLPAQSAPSMSGVCHAAASFASPAAGVRHPGPVRDLTRRLRSAHGAPDVRACLLPPPHPASASSLRPCHVIAAIQTTPRAAASRPQYAPGKSSTPPATVRTLRPFARDAISWIASRAFRCGVPRSTYFLRS
ncbi:hypothetical protein GGX14DRAFT_568908 [Mycena pura]|uniref:Uncharacterized protein n=1 Tax=Mycena pura TaxID=153505 RepID=A0AAD6YA70_9AGAR|nr:hypothetical protein GGX14DRAFT_568908 [Mycena pura]